MQFQYLEKITNVTERTELISQIDAALSSVYTGTTLLKSIEDLVRADIATDMVEELKKASESEIRAYLESLKKELSEMPLMYLTVAITPTNQMIKKITDWLQKNNTTHFLLEITVIPGIIAGVILEQNGKRKNYSLSQLLTQ